MQRKWLAGACSPFALKVEVEGSVAADALTASVAQKASRMHDSGFMAHAPQRGESRNPSAESGKGWEPVDEACAATTGN
jgi:hypothetical protein